MKFILVLTCFTIVQSSTYKREDSLLSIAFQDLTKSINKPNRELMIMNFAENKTAFDEVLLKNLKANNLQQKIKTNYKKFFIKSGVYNRYIIKESAILFLDSIKALAEFNEVARVSEFSSRSLKLFVYCNKATVNKLSTVAEAVTKLRVKLVENSFGLDTDMTNILQNQYFVLNERKSIKLMTFVWYLKGACHVPQLIEVNRFDKKKRKWNKSEFTIQKHENFHGCKLTIDFIVSYPEFIYVKDP